MWGGRLNLTAIFEGSMVARLHFLDSLAVAPHLTPTGPVMDIGSGAGFPGIPIKLVCPDKAVYLVEPRRRRANFLRHVIRELRLTGVHVIESRLEELPREDVPPMMETVTRGFSDIRGFIKTSGKLLDRGGQCLLMQGPKGPATLEDLQGWISRCGFVEHRTLQFSLPFGTEQRTVIALSKA